MDKHLSSQFDSDLGSVSTRVMEMGGVVEAQIRSAIYALAHLSVESAIQASDLERRVNALEVEIDQELSTIIARRQPTARDLRLLIAISRTTANLERAGDEAEKIARMVRSIIDGGHGRTCASPPTWHPGCCARPSIPSRDWTHRPLWRSSRRTIRSTASSTVLCANSSPT